MGFKPPVPAGRTYTFTNQISLKDETNEYQNTGVYNG